MAVCEVILREDLPNLGSIGDVVRVRPGYARNYLFPRGLAVAASRKNLRQLEHAKRLIADKIERDRKSAQGIAAKLHGLPLIMTASVLVFFESDWPRAILRRRSLVVEPHQVDRLSIPVLRHLQ